MPEGRGSAEGGCASDLWDSAGHRDAAEVACSEGCPWGLGLGMQDEKG